MTVDREESHTLMSSFRLIALILLTAASTLLSGCERESAPMPGRIIFEQADFDAGQVEQGDEIEHDFLFRNEGDLDLHISQVRSSCGCMTGSPAMQTIPPGGRGEIEVHFNTTSYFGKVSRTISVLSDDPKNPIARLRIRANIGFDVAVDPPEIYVGKVTRGSSVRTYPRVLLGPGRDVQLTAVESESRIVDVDWADVGQSERERRLQLKIRRDAPSGEFREQILIRTSSPRRPVVAVPVVGIVEEATDKLLSNQG